MIPKKPRLVKYHKKKGSLFIDAKEAAPWKEYKPTELILYVSL